MVPDLKMADLELKLDNCQLQLQHQHLFVWAQGQGRNSKCLLLNPNLLHRADIQQLNQQKGSQYWPKEATKLETDCLYRPPTPFAVKPIGAFYVFLAANVLAALYAPIQDCDETFNYWEPTHYLSHGYGLQTWEYSPEYAIRSWLYIALNALVGTFRRLLPFSTKVKNNSSSVICKY